MKKLSLISFLLFGMSFTSCLNLDLNGSQDYHIRSVSSFLLQSVDDDKTWEPIEFDTTKISSAIEFSQLRITVLADSIDYVKLNSNGNFFAFRNHALAGPTMILQNKVSFISIVSNSEINTVEKSYKPGDELVSLFQFTPNRHRVDWSSIYQFVMDAEDYNSGESTLSIAIRPNPIIELKQPIKGSFTFNVQFSNNTELKTNSDGFYLK